VVLKGILATAGAKAAIEAAGGRIEAVEAAPAA
jgi:ribosomal protein L15